MHGFILYSRDRGVFSFFQNEAVRADAARIVAATAFTGLVNFDLIAGDDGTAMWLECNPRVFFTLDIHAAAGLDYLAPALARGSRAREAALARLDRQAAHLSGRQLRKLRASALALATGARLTPLDVGLAATRLADPMFLARDRWQGLRRKLTAWRRRSAGVTPQPVS
jgi:predicted ATP-grasp superfamily ATP-dependent carboligase